MKYQFDNNLKRNCIRFLFILFSLTVISFPVMATWTDFFYENFEQDNQDWPWNRNFHNWALSNYPPPSPIYHTWGVEDSTVFYNDNPAIPHYRSAWCSGLADNLIPGDDEYNVIPGYPAIAQWGPFSLEDAIEAEGNFRIWANVESNANGTGDDFYFLVLSEDDNGDVTTAIAYDLPGANVYEWPLIEFDFSQLSDEDGNEINFIGDETLYIQLYFEEDGDANRGLGVFIDNIGMGYDNGMYDYYAYTINVLDASYEPVELIHPGETYFLGIHFTFSGPTSLQADNEVWHKININDVPFDSVRSTWENSRHGFTHEYMFETAWVPADTGLYDISFTLDDGFEQEEDAEDNNVFEMTRQVTQPQTIPTLDFIAPSDTSALNYENEITVVGHNSPENEAIYVSFFYTTNPNNVNEGERINELQNQIIANGIQRTFNWELTAYQYNDLDSSAYYIIALINDGAFPYQTAVSQGCYMKMVGVNDNNTQTIPETFEITSVYPNPFNPSVEINIAVPNTSNLVANWYSIDGRLIHQNTYNNVSAGYKSINWTPKGISSGVYFLRLSNGANLATTKVVYIK